METLETVVNVLEKLWWLIFVFFGGLIALVWRTAIKTNHVMRQVESVKSHDKEIKEIKTGMNDLKEDVTRVREALDKHNSKQDGDMSAIMTLLLEVSEALKAIPEVSPLLQTAHKDFQKHLVKRKETPK